MKNQWLNLAGVLTMALAVTACAGDRDADTARTGDSPAVGTAGTATTSAADQEFVQEQLAMGQAEIELGRLAQEKGSHAEVKRFGEMMVRDHQMAAEELKQIAGNTAAPGTATDPSRGTDAHREHQDALEELRGLSGREFDRKYIERMIDDHEEGVRDVERRAENADNPQVRQWAAKTLPKMQQHLEQAKTIKETLDQAGDDNTPGRNR